MSPRIYCVYVHENQINGKVYVGMTCCPEKRFAGKGSNYKQFFRGRKSKFGLAIEKYGWDNFTHEIIWDNLTINEARRMERHLIDFYSATDPQYGYNSNQGGAGSPEKILSSCV